MAKERYEEAENTIRVNPSVLPAESRKKNFDEVEMAMSAEQAIYESKRCLRCYLDFIKDTEKEK
jgi:hypothetical protein